MTIINDAWDYIYGSKSHLTLAGKLLIGAPMAPVIFIAVGTYALLDVLFTKRN